MICEPSTTSLACSRARKPNSPGIMHYAIGLALPWELSSCISEVYNHVAYPYRNSARWYKGGEGVEGNCLGVQGTGRSVIQGHDLDGQTLLNLRHWGNDNVIISVWFKTLKKIADILQGSITTCFYERAVRIENSLENGMRQIRSQLEILAGERIALASELARKTGWRGTDAGFSLAQLFDYTGSKSVQLHSSTAEPITHYIINCSSKRDLQSNRWLSLRNQKRSLMIGKIIRMLLPR